MISISRRKICRSIALLCMITLVSCTTAPPMDLKMPAPPGELMAVAPPLAKLNDAQPMPQQDFLGQAAVDAGQYRNVANQLTNLQAFVRRNCDCYATKPVAAATRPPVPLVSDAELPPRGAQTVEIPGLLPPEFSGAS